jgi:hypothetical protein
MKLKEKKTSTKVSMKKLKILKNKDWNEKPKYEKLQLKDYIKKNKNFYKWKRNEIRNY